MVLGWLVGVFGLSAWHLGGWAQLQRLKRRMVRTVGDLCNKGSRELALRLGVHRAIELFESALVEVPTVVGWLRPVILLPASALTGLSPEQLEAILAHELAHIRRYDYLVNIVQTVVEILGFYHPAIWWVSHRIRIERENCCDDLAVHVCGSSLQYARALACMEEIRHSGTDLALAATGGSLMARISRLLGRPAVDDRRFAWLPGLVALFLVAGLIIPAALVLGTPDANPGTSGETTAAPATPPALESIWSKLDTLDAERLELAQRQWDALTVVQQAQRVLGNWTQCGPTEQERQTVMTEEGAKRFLDQAQKQLGPQWPSHLRSHMEDLLTQEQRSGFDRRRTALVQEATALGEPVIPALIREITSTGPHQLAARDALHQIGGPAVPSFRAFPKFGCASMAFLTIFRMRHQEEP